MCFPRRRLASDGVRHSRVLRSGRVGLPFPAADPYGFFDLTVARGSSPAPNPCSQGATAFAELSFGADRPSSVQRAFRRVLVRRLRAPFRALLRDVRLVPRHGSLDQQEVPGNLGKKHESGFCNRRSSERFRRALAARSRELRRRLHTTPHSTSLWITPRVAERAREFSRAIPARALRSRTCEARWRTRGARRRDRRRLRRKPRRR